MPSQAAGYAFLKTKQKPTTQHLTSRYKAAGAVESVSVPLQSAAGFGYKQGSAGFPAPASIFAGQGWLFGVSLLHPTAGRLWGNEAVARP